MTDGVTGGTALAYAGVHRHATEARTLTPDPHRPDAQKRSDPIGTVLVVDDTEDNLLITVRLLTDAGIHCLTAMRGWQCLEVARNQPVDLILLDIIMPRMDGWTTLAALRQEPMTRHIPVIMFTCDDRFVNRQRAMKEGAVDFLPRPVVREKLLACVRTHLSAVARGRALDAVGRDLDSALARGDRQV
jgi:CheY-like chemotaxis protein